jgi:deoxycytidylate deaminase
MISKQNSGHVLSRMITPEHFRHPVVIALVSPIGAGVDRVLSSIEDCIGAYGYRPIPISLAKLMEKVQPAGDPLPEIGTRDYYAKRMDAGDRIRRLTNHGSAVAALAIDQMNQMRGEKAFASTSAFILRSLKHKDEVALLRSVYGDSFRLFGVTTPLDERRGNLDERMASFGGDRSAVDDLIDRDERDGVDDLGQDVRAVYPRADAFIDAARGADIRGQVERLIDLMFGHPFVTPTRSEEAMRIASDASLRSAAVGRQVGAALVPALGTPVLTGTNEVPSPGGGQFWEGDDPDHRDFRSGSDPNPLYSQRVVQEILESLRSHSWLAEPYSLLEGGQLLTAAIHDDVLNGTRATALIEFVRCLHAEQAAIVNAARAGVCTTGSTLYTTTFPCHECAKAIIGSGVVEVIYIQPYPKSLVAQLYRDLIDATPPSAHGGVSSFGRIPFRPFVGVSPQWYDTFAASDSEREQSIARFDRLLATPRSQGWDERAISTREAIASKAVLESVKDMHLETSPEAGRTGHG